MVNIKIDSKKCIGCGLCSSTCPENFEMSGGKAKVKKVSKDLSCEKKAAKSCPVGAIIVK